MNVEPGPEVNPENESHSQEGTLDRVLRAASLISLCLLCVLVGLILAAFNTMPYQWTVNAFLAWHAITEQQKMLAYEYPDTLWQEYRFGERPTVPAGDSDADRLTVYSSGAGAEVTLVNDQGKTLHSWNAPFSKVWPERSWIGSSIPDDRFYVRRSLVLPNGDLLAMYETPMMTPNGVGFAKLDAESNVLWQYDGNCHHDFAVNADGDIFVLTHELKPSQHPNSRFGREVNIEDFIDVLSPDGTRKHRFSLLDAFFDSPFYRVFVLQREFTGDLLHANTVNLIGPEFAKHYPEIEAGNLMICFRNLNLVVAIDPGSGEIVWGTSGPWHYPHDPDPLPNGNVLIFDNCVSNGLEAYSRVVEFDPRSRRKVWTYSGKGETRLRSDIRSTQQRLANGNTLIAESDGGRIVEVNSRGEVEWHFINPRRGGEDDQYIPIMVGVRRYQRSDLPFLNSPSDE